jgi:capsular polysaccharide transport system permease protein
VLTRQRIFPPSHHGTVIGALMMREIITRYGREGLGFLWLVAEPLMFCLFVLVLWSFIKPEYEHGIRLGAFVMTGYMSMLLIRHVTSSSMAAIQANVGLIYHRQISVLHIYISRAMLEILGTSIAFVVVYLILLTLGQVSLPHDMLKILGGWSILAVQSTGLAWILAALALRSDAVERIVPVLQYGLIPVSGAFVMAAWLPQEYRDILLIVPFPHAVEMVRAGVFGEFVPTYYNVSYALFWALGMNLLALLLLARARHHLEAE